MKIKSLIQLTVTAAAFPLAASAQIVWDGGTDLTWEDGTNWVGDVAPADDLVTNTAELNTSITLAAARQVSGIDFASAATLSGGSIEIGTGGLAVNADAIISSDLVVNTALSTTLNGSLDLSGTITGTENLTFTAGTSTALSITGVNGDDDTSGYSGDITFDGVDATVSRYFIGNTGVGTHTLSLLNGASLTSSGSHLQMGSRNIIISGGAQINQANSNNVYGLDGVISGTGGLTFGHVGGGNRDKIQLEGTANTFTGGVTIDGVDVHTSGASSLGDSGNTITLDNSGFLNMLGGGDHVANRDIILDGAGKIQGTGTWIYSGTITGGGSLELVGSGNENRFAGSSANTYTGGTILDNVGVRSAAGTYGTGAITLRNNAYIKNQNSSFTLANDIIIEETGGGIEAGWSNRRITLTGQISGDGALTIRNDSSETYINNSGNTYTGGTVILAKLAAENAGSLGTGSLTFDGGFLRNDNSNIDLGTRDIIIDSGGAEIQIGWTNRRVQMNGIVSGTGAITVMDDSSSLILSNAGNTYSGGTEIRGFVQADSGGLGTGVVTLNEVTDGRGQLKNNGSAATHDNNIIVGANGGRMQAGWDSALTLDGVVSGSGQLYIAGDSGSVVLGNAGNTFSGDIALEAGNSRLNVASLESGNYDGIISGDGTFQYSGSGTQILSGANTFTGGSTLSSGVVQLGNAAALGTGAIALSGGTLDVNGNVVSNALADNPNGTFRNTGAAVDYSSTAINMNGGTLTVDGTGEITLGDINRTDGTPTLIKEGTNTVNLTGSSDNVAFNAEVEAGALVLAKATSGSVHALSSLTVNGGTAELGGSGGDQIYDGGDVTMNGGTFDLGAFDERVKNLTLAGGDVIGSGTLTVNSFSGAGAIDARSGTVSAVLAGDAGLTKTTAGTVTLNAANTFSGATVVSEGSLILGASGSIDNTSSITVADGAIFDASAAGGLNLASGKSIAGYGQVIGDLSLAAGATFLFGETDTLTVTGSVTLDGSFGADDLVGLSAATALGTYVLIDGTATDFSTLGIQNWGEGNAYDLGSGISAYFQSGSLELVVVPEPGTFALLAGMLALGSVMIRRRRA